MSIDLRVAQKTGDEVPRVSVERMEGSRMTPVTPNWCDKRTWYCKSTKRVAQTLSHISDYSLYQSPTSDVVWVDNYHGLYSDEDTLKTADGDIPRLKVYVDDIEKIEQDPHYAHFHDAGHWDSGRQYELWDGCFNNSKAWKCIRPHMDQTPVEGVNWTELTGGEVRDFSVDYNTGRVYFRVALGSEDVVKVDTWEAGDSCWIIKPIANRKIKLLDSEVQFSVDIAIVDTVKFQAWGKVDTFAPQYTPVPYPSGTYIPLADAVVYKNRMDFINEANGAYPTIKGNDTEPHWRNLHVDVDTFPFKYQSVTEIVQDMEIRVWLEHDAVFEGTMATATFYCMSYKVDEALP